MKQIHFRVLDFTPSVPDSTFYFDAGPVVDLVEHTKWLFRQLRLPADDASLIKMGIDVTALPSSNGHYFRLRSGGKDYLFLHYRDLSLLQGSPELDRINSAYLEARAAIELGVRGQLEGLLQRTSPNENLSQLGVDEICSLAVTYVIQRDHIGVVMYHHKDFHPEEFVAGYLVD